MPKPAGRTVTTRRIDHDTVLAIVPIAELLEFKAKHGLRTISCYWPSHSAHPILLVEPIPPGEPTQEPK